MSGGYGDDFDSGNEQAEEQRERTRDAQSAQGIWTAKHGSPWQNTLGHDRENDQQFEDLMREQREKREGGQNR